MYSRTGAGTGLSTRGGREVSRRRFGAPVPLEDREFGEEQEGRRPRGRPRRRGQPRRAFGPAPQSRQPQGINPVALIAIGGGLVVALIVILVVACGGSGGDRPAAQRGGARFPSVAPGQTPAASSKRQPSAGLGNGPLPAFLSRDNTGPLSGNWNSTVAASPTPRASGPSATPRRKNLPGSGGNRKGKGSPPAVKKKQPSASPASGPGGNEGDW